MKNPLRKNILTNAALLVFMAGAGYGLTVYLDRSSAPEPAIVPIPAQTKVSPTAVPAFAFLDTKGNTHQSPDFKGAPLIINFWASWCPPCVAEMPTLIEVAAENPDVTLIAVSSDQDKDAMSAFLKTLPLEGKDNIIIVPDPQGKITRNIFQSFRLPETLLAGKDGLLKHKLIGADWTKEDMKNLLDELR